MSLEAVAGAGSNSAGVVGSATQFASWLGRGVVALLGGGKDILVQVISTLWRFAAPLLGVIWAALSSNVGVVGLGLFLAATLVIIHHQSLQDKIKNASPLLGSFFDGIKARPCLSGTAYTVLLVAFGALAVSNGIIPI